MIIIRLPSFSLFSVVLNMNWMHIEKIYIYDLDIFLSMLSNNLNVFARMADYSSTIF